MFKTQLTKTLDEIVAGMQAGRTIVFCGAGISFNSGIPVVPQLMSAILDKLGFQGNELDRLLKSFPSFEGFMQLLLENVRDASIFDVFDPHGAKGTARPDGARYANANHALIAELIKAGRLKTVVTTNFDRLIEEELQCGEPKWVEKRDYDVFYLEQSKGSTRGYAEIAWGSEPVRPRIIKIHGSMHEKGELAITLARVASQTYSSARRAVIDYVFASGAAHSQVLILGYSCSDVFDITPGIEQLGKASRMKVILVEHLPSQESGKARVEDIQAREYKNPFKEFQDGKRLHYNTDELVQHLAKRTLGLDVLAAGRSRYPWQPVIDHWHRSMQEYEKGAAIAGLRGRILQYTGQVGEAVEEYRKALQVDPGVESSAFIEDCWRRLAEAYGSLGEYENAIEAFRRALKMSRKIGDIGNEARHLCSLANVYMALEDRPTSGDVVMDRIGSGTVQAALKYDRNWNRNLGEIKALSGTPRNTIELLFHALDLAEDAKDDENRARILRGLGDLYNLAGKYYYVLTYYERALKLSEQVGDIEGQVQLLCSLGDACSETGNIPEASRYYTRAGAVVKETGLRKYEALARYGQGRVERLNGKLTDSLMSMEQALSMAEEMKDKKSQILCLIELGRIDAALGGHPDAIKKFELALEVLGQTRNKEFKPECTGRIGISYECMGEYEKAGVYYENALNMARQIGNISQEALWLSYQGCNYQRLPDGNYITTRELIEWATEIAQKTRNDQVMRICLENSQRAYNIHMGAEKS